MSLKTGKPTEALVTLGQKYHYSHAIFACSWVGKIIGHSKFLLVPVIVAIVLLHNTGFDRSVLCAMRDGRGETWSVDGIVCTQQAVIFGLPLQQPGRVLVFTPMATTVTRILFCARARVCVCVSVGEGGEGGTRCVRVCGQARVKARRKRLDNFVLFVWPLEMAIRSAK